MTEFDNSLYIDHKKAHIGLINIVTPQDQETARNILRDLMLFNNALQSEMKKLKTDAGAGVKIDRTLYEKMLQVQNRYDYAITGFRAFDDDTELKALTALSESIEDLMVYMNSRKH